MTVKLRVLGDPDEVAKVLAVLDGVLDLAGNDRVYPNRGGFGVRVYVEARFDQWCRPRPTVTTGRPFRPARAVGPSARGVPAGPILGGYGARPHTPVPAELHP